VLLASGAIVAVIAIVVTFTVIALNTKKTAPSAVSNGPTGAALTKVVSDTTSVPPSILDTVGAGSVTTPPTAVSGTPLTAGGKPEVLYIGAEFCPYCALQQWGLVVALSRFGTFTGLRTVHSSSTDIYPNTSTWTFYGSSYTSRYLTFTPVEQATNVPDATAPLGYVPLQSPTAGQQASLRKYDPELSIPFTDIGNKYVIIGASASPQVLGQELGSDRLLAARPVQPGSSSRERDRQLHHRRHLQADQPAGHCLYADCHGPGLKDMTD